jgi:hypothetical protein
MAELHEKPVFMREKMCQLDGMLGENDAWGKEINS